MPHNVFIAKFGIHVSKSGICIAKSEIHISEFGIKILSGCRQINNWIFGLRVQMIAQIIRKIKINSNLFVRFAENV